MKALRFGLRLEKQAGRYPHDVDYVTRTRRFAEGYKSRERYLSWDEVPRLLAAIVLGALGRVPPERIARARELRASGSPLKDIAAELGVTPQSASRYFAAGAGEPSEGNLVRAQLVAWIIATAGRASEMRRAELSNHDLERWVLRMRRTKTGGPPSLIPIAPPFRRLLQFALQGRPAEGSLYPPTCDANMNRMLRLACHRAGIERVSPNDLRRTLRASFARPASRSTTSRRFSDMPRRRCSSACTGGRTSRPSGAPWSDSRFPSLLPEAQFWHIFPGRR